MSKRFLLALAIIILGFGGILWLTKDKAGAPASGSTSGQPTNHLYGAGRTGVILIEYGDYQCPACEAYHPIVKAVAEKFKEDIHLQFRNFPLSSIHPNAFASARAAEAADKQGKFWEMHDLLYEQQSSWAQSTGPKVIFDQFAVQLGLDLTKFQQDYASDEVNDLINADIKEAKNIGADSTPTFVLDGQKIDENPRDQAGFEKLINDAIAAKNQ
jgi:protein-disulfide isomerase